MSDYEQLDDREIADIERQIDEGMRTINGDTAPVQVTARQAGVLLAAYRLVREVHPNWDSRYSKLVSAEQMDEIMRIAGL